MRATGAAAFLTVGLVALAGHEAGATQCDAASPEIGAALGLHLPAGARYLPWLWEIRRVGATRVSLAVSWEQDDLRANTVAPAAATPPDDDVRAAIRDAHAVGLEVMLFPMITLRDPQEGQWRGVIEPESVSAWFDSYRDFILHWARIAREEGVEVFSVGSELGSMEQYDVAWREIIGAVRVAYEGVVIYSANWDRGEQTPFWDALDRVGMTAYFEMPGVGDAAAAEAAWAPILADIGELSARLTRPVVFTELGYVAQLGAGEHPWDYTAEGVQDLATQAGLYDGALRAFCSQAWLESVFVWNWFGAGGPRQSGYSPRNTPAADVIRDAALLWTDEVE